MSITRTAAAAFVASLALGGFGVAVPAHADDAAPQPCAQQQTQYDKASAKLAVLTARYEKHPTAENRAAKKAQQQRVAKSQARLEKCQADQASTTA